MLLGIDDLGVRWWRDERVMDRSYCDAGTRGENHRRAPLSRAVGAALIVGGWLLMLYSALGHLPTFVVALAPFHGWTGARS